MDIFRGPQIYNFVLLAPKLLFFDDPPIQENNFRGPPKFQLKFRGPLLIL